MLVEPDIRKLGDFSLSKEEALKKTYEDTDRKLQQYRLVDQDELANEQRRLGHPMQSNELINRITRINSEIWAEDSYANPNTVAGFYTSQMNDDGHKEKVFLCAFEKGWMPEFSIVVEDAAGLPVKERRGWRTVLVRLLEGNYLSFSAVISAFGEALGLNAKNWESLTRDKR